MRDIFLDFLRREIEITCINKRVDAEAGILGFSAVRSCIAFLSGEVATAGVLELITDSEWEEFNGVLSEIEKELYDMVR